MQTPSTINFAERIIAAIRLQEPGDDQPERFFDLQTSTGFASKEDGYFEYQQVVGIDTSSLEWVDADCPGEVIRTFRPYISSSGVPSRQMRSREIARPANAADFVT